MNKRLPYFFRDRTTEYFGLIHAALFGSETVELEEAEKLLGISKETVAQLKQYEEEREDMEASLFIIENTVPFVPKLKVEIVLQTGQDTRDRALLRAESASEEELNLRGELTFYQTTNACK